MRTFRLLAGLWGLAGLLLLVVSHPVLAQPVPVPDQHAVPQDGPPDLGGIMKAVSGGIEKTADTLLASKRIAEMKDEGVIVTPFLLNLPDNNDAAFSQFVTTWVQEKMTTSLIAQDHTGFLGVIDRAKVDKAMKALKLDAKALNDPDTWVQLGKATGAKYLVTGSVSMLPVRERPLSLAFSLTARLVHIDTGKAVAAGSDEFFFPERPAAPPPPPPANE